LHNEDNMQEPSEGDASLVVVEAGAKWPTCAGEYQQTQPNSVVEIQAESESGAAFVARVRRRIAALRTRGNVRVGLLAANGEVDRAAKHAKYELARVLARALEGSGELVLTASLASGDAESLRHELFALAGALCDELKGDNVSVSVRFSDARESGMRPSYQSVTDEAEAASS
jgi:hypothetical protein